MSARAGSVLLWPLLAIGLFSLLLWRWTGDLRIYDWVQFFPCLALPLLFLLFPPKYTGTSYWFIAAALYALAKMFEFLDAEIYSIGSVVGGHALKHLAARRLMGLSAAHCPPSSALARTRPCSAA